MKCKNPHCELEALDDGWCYYDAPIDWSKFGKVELVVVGVLLLCVCALAVLAIWAMVS